MKRTYPKHVSALIDDLLAEGWSIKRGKHYHIYSPYGRLRATLSVTSSDKRAFLNFKADVRKAKENYCSTIDSASQTL
jgi:hypothetical protein